MSIQALVSPTQHNDSTYAYESDNGQDQAYNRQRAGGTVFTGSSWATLWTSRTGRT